MTKLTSLLLFHLLCVALPQWCASRWTYVEPPWWDYIERTVDNVQQCKRRQFPPAHGTSCGRSDKSCFWGEQACAGVGLYPEIRCICDTQRWKCTELSCPIQKACDFIGFGDKLIECANQTQAFAVSQQGTIPTEIGLLTGLTALEVTYNAVTGTIPSEIGRLFRLTRLLMDGNSNLGGSIPSQIGRLGSLMALSITMNAVGGPIPTQVGRLVSLASLDLSNNNLSGSIPSEIANLDYLENLHLENNGFLTGTVPDSFCTVDGCLLRRKIDCDWCTCPEDELALLFADDFP